MICKAYFKTHIEPTYFGIFHVWFNFANLRRLRSQYYTTHFIAHIYIYTYIYQISDITYVYIERERETFIVTKRYWELFSGNTQNTIKVAHTQIRTPVYTYMHHRICIHQSSHASSLAGGPFLHRRVIWHGGGGHLWQHVPPTGGEDGSQRQLGADSLEAKLKGSKLAKGKRFHRFGGE